MKKHVKEEDFRNELGFMGRSTLAKLRQMFLKAVNDHVRVDCPVCDRPAQVYRRRLTKALVKDLIAFALISGRTDRWMEGGWVNIKEVNVRGGDYAKLEHWGLIERREVKDKKNSDKEGVGKWRVTEKGNQFLEGQIKVPASYYEYKNTVLEWSEKKENVYSFLPDFKYAEIWP